MQRSSICKNCEMPRTLRKYVFRKLTKRNGSVHETEDNSLPAYKSDERSDGSVYVFCLKLQYGGTATCHFIILVFHYGQWRPTKVQT
jgi:hypothetical protein